MTAPPARWLSGFRFAARTRATPFWKGVSGILWAFPGTKSSFPLKFSSQDETSVSAVLAQPLHDEGEQVHRDDEIARGVPEAPGVVLAKKAIGQLQALLQGVWSGHVRLLVGDL